MNYGHSMTANELLCKRVSFQDHAWSPLSRELSIGEVLDLMKKGGYASEITRLRTFLNTGDLERYDSFKKRLPGVTFCGTFNEKRKCENLKAYNHLVIIDIDKLSPGELEGLKQVLLNDQFVSCFWESPSKRGIKGLVQLDYSFPLAEFDVNIFHKNAFASIVVYFSNKYGIDLDISGSDTARLCFLSYDPNLVLKTCFEPFPIKRLISTEEPSEERSKEAIEKPKQAKFIHKTSRNVLLNPEGKNSPRDRATIKSITKFLNKRNKSMTYDYDNWYRVAFAIANTFTHDIGEEYFLRLCRLDGTKHNEIQSENLLRYCYENSKKEITFKTLVYLAKNAGYKTVGGSEDG